MIQLKTTLDETEVDKHRREECANYEDCLMEAGKKQWRSFSCLGCTQYEATPPEKISLCVGAPVFESDYPDGDFYGSGLNSSLGRKLKGLVREDAKL